MVIKSLEINPLSPERPCFRLMFAVLRTGVQDCFSTQSSIKKEALSWFYSKESNHIHSVIFICETLSINYDLLKDLIEKGLKKEIKTIKILYLFERVEQMSRGM